MDKNQIKNLVRQMTLKEKAGQVTQLPSRYFQIKGSQLNGKQVRNNRVRKMAGRKYFRENGCRVYAQYTGREYETEPPQDSNDVYDRYHSWISDDFPGTTCNELFI